MHGSGLPDAPYARFEDGWPEEVSTNSGSRAKAMVQMQCDIQVFLCVERRCRFELVT